MDILSVVAMSLICASLIILLKTYAPSFYLPASVIASLSILIVIISLSKGAFDVISEISRTANIDEENIKLMFKALGICYITQIGRDVCIDCGVSALGDKVDLAGKISIAVLSLPLLMQVLQIITDLVK